MKVCFIDFADDVTSFIFNKIKESYSLKYDDYSEEVIIDYSNNDIIPFLKTTVSSEDMSIYFNKFKDEFTRRGVSIRWESELFHTDRGSFFIDEEEFFPSLFNNKNINKEDLSTFLIKKLTDMDSRIRSLEQRINNI